jgi:predicted ABC-type ATPase
VNRPTLTIVAGANGAGKSTLTNGNLDVFGLFPLLDPDVFANLLLATGTGVTPIWAGREVIRLSKQHLERRESFAVETTLSGKSICK